jgi:putative DNA-invertase from lambdoid prophage Rac
MQIRVKTPLNQILGYLRVSTDKQTVESQKLAIYDYASKNNLIVDDFVEVTVSSSKSTEKRKVEELLARLQKGDTLIISELSRLGRSTIELLTLVKQITDQSIRLIIIKQNLSLYKGDETLSNKIILTIFSMLAEIERDLIIQRTKEGLVAARSRGKILGKPRGTIQFSIYDSRQPDIKALLAKKVPIASISKIIGIGKVDSLRNYVRRFLSKKI